MTTLTKAELAEIEKAFELTPEFVEAASRMSELSLRAGFSSERVNALRLVRHIRAQDEKLRWHEKRSCSVCLGGPLPDGKPCICGGGGSASSEAHGLRIVLHNANEKLRRVAELVDPKHPDFEPYIYYEYLDTALNGEKQT